MSLYPSAPDIFVDRDGEDAIASSDPNNAYDAIENVENFLGAAGEPQSKLATLINAFRNMFQPLPQCSWIDADTIGILPSSAVLFATNNFVIKRNTEILTCCLSLHLDTGSEIASAWYDLYLVGDGANSLYTAKFVLQGSAPSGLTYCKKINSFRNDGSSNLLKFYQDNNLIMWDVPINVVAPTTQANSWSAAISCTSAIPNISTRGLFGLTAFTSGNAQGVWIRPNGAAWSTTPQNGFYCSANSIDVNGQRISFTDELQQIQFHGVTQNPTIAIDVEGYYINI
jgi:hypothetical protein